MTDHTATQRLTAAVKRRVIPNWRSRLRDYSTVALALSTAVAAAWSALPADWLSYLPVAWVARGIGAITAFGLVGKFVSQGNSNDAAK